MNSPENALRVGQTVGVEDLPWGIRLTPPDPARPHYTVAAVEADYILLAAASGEDTLRVPRYFIKEIVSGGAASEAA